MQMSMTHYMELLATNQPWNLIIFMAIPVIFAEYIAITELYILLKRNLAGFLKQSSRLAGILAGFYFLGIFIHLFTTVYIPLTLNGGWRGPADVIAVSFYLLGVVPLFGIALLELDLLLRGKTAEEKLNLHVILVASFLVVAHIAMVFGMLDPKILS